MLVSGTTASTSGAAVQELADDRGVGREECGAPRRQRVQVFERDHGEALGDDRAGAVDHVAGASDALGERR